MDFILYLLVGLLVGAVAGFFIGKGRSGGVSENLSVGHELAAAKARVELLSQQIEDLKADAAEENKILLAIKPFETTLGEMKTKVEAIETQRQTQYSALEEQLRFTLQSTEQLRNRTNALTQAMSDNRARGKWGEIQLERIVEAAGMLNRVDFYTQETVAGDEGNLRPDMVVRLPGNRSIPVDSKVPFDAYLEAMELNDPDDNAQVARKKSLLEKHVADLRSHVTKLSNKKYWENYANAADYVVAFIPSENLLAAAMELDPTLGEFAIKKKVALSSPMNLFMNLQTVALIWQNTTDQEALNGLIKLGKDLFSRMATVATHAAKVGSSLDRSVVAYNAFVGSLERNLLTTTRQLNAKEVSQFGETEIVEPEIIDERSRDFTKFTIEPEALTGGIREDDSNGDTDDDEESTK